MSEADQSEGIDETSGIVAEASEQPAYPHHLVVGIGASAGGLEALEEFFAELPPDTGIAFVVVTHLAPGSVSVLPELIARYSRMPVVTASEGITLEPNHVYVQPPGVTLGLLQGKLHLFEPPEDGPKPLPIDFFFRCLAQDLKEKSAGIVLSGTGTDGTLGLKEIKAASGLTMAQDEATARYPGMPHSASTTLALDHVLPPRDMARELVSYAKGPTFRSLSLRSEPSDYGEVMSRIFVLLRNRTRHDFSHYKATTTARRIARRMHVHQIDTTKEYLRYVQVNPQELDLHFREFLIGVTSFFRAQTVSKQSRSSDSASSSRTRPRPTSSAAGWRVAPPAKRRIRSPCCSASRWTPRAFVATSRSSRRTSIPSRSTSRAPASIRQPSRRT